VFRFPSTTRALQPVLHFPLACRIFDVCIGDFVGGKKIKGQVAVEKNVYLVRKCAGGNDSHRDDTLWRTCPIAPLAQTIRRRPMSLTFDCWLELNVRVTAAFCPLITTQRRLKKFSARPPT
jgi:hypothetical protein